MSDLVKVADWTERPWGTVIFVHGLGGHIYETWRRASNDNTFWPLWLAEDVEGIAVYALGYQAPPTNWLGTSMPLQDRAGNVRARLLATLGERDEPIAFVCHSLGGLIVKQLLLDLQQQKDRNPQAAAFLKRIRQIVFLATPHTGSWKGTLLDRIRFLAWPSSIARVLVANDPTLRSINVAYRGLADERRKVLRHLVLYETQQTAVGGIVDEASADPGLPGEPTAIDADHITIAKPRDRSALQYVLTRQLIASLPRRDDQTTSFKSYALPDIKVERPKNILPKALRVAMIMIVMLVTYKGVQALMAPTNGSVIAVCGSVATKGWIWGSTITAGGPGSKNNCLPNPP